MTRDEAWDRLDAPWDLVVVGGGITGAGVFAQAAAAGYRCLLLEQRDFAWGTSSRSGKLVHGGLRYIAQGQIRTSFHSVREREDMLRRYAGLVTPLEFVIPMPRRGGCVMKGGLAVLLAMYDRMAGRPSRKFRRGEELSAHVPGLAGLERGAWSFLDGTTDDARLVLRVLAEGRAQGGTALNYVSVARVLRDGEGRVAGVAAVDVVTGRSREVRARAVVNATGAWADGLRCDQGGKPRLRPLRGSHLVLPFHRLPLDRAVALRSPTDGRNLYILPWEGRILLGTTDLDHPASLSVEPAIAPEEGRYLLEAVNAFFPQANLVPGDVLSTIAGVRPVIGTGKKDPSRESRDEALWVDDGLVTIAGGKLTTFRRMARRALDLAVRDLGAPGQPPVAGSPVDPDAVDLPARVAGRFGPDAPAVLAGALPGGLETIEDTRFLWAELDWAVRHEQVVHLDDLLLRRTRVGLLLPDGGASLLPALGPRVRPALGWDEARWDLEAISYNDLWRRFYSPALLVDGKSPTGGAR